MAEPKRKPAAKQVIDVHQPGKTAADSTSKPIIVNHRQIIRDPMVTSEATSPVPETKTAPELPKDVAVPEVAATPPVVEEPTEEPAVEASEVLEPEAPTAPAEEIEPAQKGGSHELVLTPPSQEETTDADQTDETAAPEEAKPEEPADDEEVAGTEKIKQGIPDADTNPQAAEAAADEAEIKRQEELQKLAEKKQYFLPINAVEQRRAQQFIALGIFVSIVLALAWVDIALDAGLIQIDNVKPVTNFFSN